MDANGYIDVKLVSLETGERFASVDPEEIIREIQRMAWEKRAAYTGHF